MSDTQLLATRLEEAQAQRDTAIAQLRDARDGDASVWRTYAQPVLSLAVLLMFGGTLAAVLFRAVPTGSETIVNMMLGGLMSMVMAVIQFWFGSSRGSERKTEVIANLSAPRKPSP